MSSGSCCKGRKKGGKGREGEGGELGDGDGVGEALGLDAVGDEDDEVAPVPALLEIRYALKLLRGLG